MTWDGYPEDRGTAAPHLLRDAHTGTGVPAMWEPDDGFDGLWLFGRRLPRMTPAAAVENELDYVGPYQPPSAAKRG